MIQQTWIRSNTSHARQFFALPPFGVVYTDANLHRHGSSFGHTHGVGPSDNSSFSVSPVMLSPTSSTESLALSSPEVQALKQKTVVCTSNQNSTFAETFIVRA